MRRPPAVDPYSRGYAGEEHEDPRLSRPPVGRGRGRQAEDELDDVFEDEPAPRPRASARDYQAAYRDSEGGFEEERRRSSGPWILLLALLVAALVTGGVVWFYNTQMKKTVATPGAADQVPVVSAPEQPAKTSPQPATDSQGSVAPALKKKQIYDRIVGDQEVSGDQVVPTEEVPVPPTTADQVAPSQSQGGEPVPVPTPDAPAGAGDEPLPLPPPPGSDTQGSLDQEGIEKIAAAAAAAPAEESSTAPPTAADGEISPATAMPPPEKSSDGAVVASAASAEAAPDAPAEDIAAAPAETRAEANVEDPSAAAPVKKKPAATKQTSTAANKKVAPAAKEEDPGAPLVLVAPSQQPIVSPSQNQPVAGEAAVQESTAQPPKKKRTLLDLFKGGSADAGNATAVDETQVASLPARTGETAPAPAPEQNAASGGSGYVVQLASFRSEAEATAEYGRLKGRYPNVVGGLPPRISEASVAGSTRYLLRLGPLASRDQATEVCNSLFAGGERDCLVRTQ